MQDQLKDYTNHTGGAYGIDTLGHIVGYWYGFKNHNHYRPVGNERLSQKLRLMMESAVIVDLDLARGEVNRLLGKNYKDNLYDNLQTRNYFQAKFADAVYCFSRKISDTDVAGGTNTALQLAIKMGKDAYVFDVIELRWYVYNEELKKLCECSETPVLTTDYAIIGTRDVEDYKVLNKRTGNWESREQYLGKEVETKVTEAIEELYKNTIENLPDLQGY